MRRADRLLQIVQILRRRREPTTARSIADELEVVPRTVYRDIADLQASQVPIEGEPGYGYRLRKGYDLPPLMFDEQELEAIVLGARMVADRGDPLLARAAQDVLGKISTVLPDRLADGMWRTGLLMPHRPQEASAFGPHLPDIRQAVRDCSKLQIDYVDGEECKSSRIVWPLGLYFYSHVTIVCTWCELRGDFRALRADRILGCTLANEKFDPKDGALFHQFVRQWLVDEKSSGQESSRAWLKGQKLRNA